MGPESLIVHSGSWILLAPQKAQTQLVSPMHWENKLSASLQCLRLPQRWLAGWLMQGCQWTAGRLVVTKNDVACLLIWAILQKALVCTNLFAVRFQALDDAGNAKIIIPLGTVQRPVDTKTRCSRLDAFLFQHAVVTGRMP